MDLDVGQDVLDGFDHQVFADPLGNIQWVVSQRKVLVKAPPPDEKQHTLVLTLLYKPCPLCGQNAWLLMHVKDNRQHFDQNTT